jgi:predicted metalloprotease
MGGVAPTSSSDEFATSPEEEELVDFVSFVLDDNQATWGSILGGQYQVARMVVFRDAVRSACGITGSATGPFYCPSDQKVYLDLGFFDQLRRSFGAPGDFAQAYVIAHEIGHHVQKLLGIEGEVRRAQSARPGMANELSVRTELQADCFAGVWGHSTAERGILETGDVEEGLNAAAAIGDDRMQRMSQGWVSPDSFTHGSSEQRVRWFRRGLDSGDPEACDTFSANDL